MIKWIVVASFLLPTFLPAVSLNYRSQTPVLVESRLLIDMKQSLPGLSLSTKGEQTLAAELKIVPLEAHIPDVTPPFDLVFTLKELSIDVDTNQKKRHFPSSGSIPSLYEELLNQMTERPLTFAIDEQFRLSVDQKNWEALAQQIPFLEEIEVKRFFQELFTHIFALSGQTLTEGAVIEKTLEAGTSLPSSFTYTITKVEGESVFAQIEGTLEKTKRKLLNQMLLGQEGVDVFFTLSGDVEGEGQWELSDALKFHIHLNYNYLASFQVGEKEWVATLRVEVNYLSR